MKFIPRHRPSARPALTNSAQRYCLRNLKTMKVVHVYSENFLAQLIAEGKVTDESHDVCIATSAEGGYSFSRAEKQREKEEMEEVH